MTAYTFDNDCVSDLYKDAYGFRPSSGFFQIWSTYTDAEKQTCWDDLCVALGYRNKYDQELENSAILEFEALVLSVLQAGAADRDTACRWIMEASTCDGDWEFLCYKHGLPYGYFKKSN